MGLSISNGSMGLTLGRGRSGGGGVTPPASLAAVWTTDAPTTDTSDADFDYYRISTPGTYTLTVTTAGYLWLHARGQGGPGGGSSFSRAGGGGGGEVKSEVVYLATGDYTIEVLDDNIAGVSNTQASVKGSDTVIGPVTAESGGKGSCRTNTINGLDGNAGPGACGGGAANGEGVNDIGIGSVGGDGGIGDSHGGGGGGLTADGVDATASLGGDGGAGTTDTFFGVAEAVGGGGGGGARAANGGTAAGSGGNANAGDGGFGANGQDAVDGFAGGGGGCGQGGTNTGGKGAAGLAGIRVPKVSAWSITEDASVAAGKFYQKNESTNDATIPLSGTLVGADGVVQARIMSGSTVVVDWADLATSSSGSFSGTVTIPPTSGLLRAEYRFKDFPVVPWVGGNWNAGLVTLHNGQSNTTGLTGNDQTVLTDSHISYDTSDDTYETTTGLALTSVAADITAASGWSVFTMIAGSPGAGSGFLTDDTAATDEPVDQVMDALTALGYRVDMFFLNQGENNVTTQASRDKWEADWAEFVSDMGAITGQGATGIPVFLTPLMTYGGALAGFTDENWSEMKTFQRQATIDRANWYLCGPGDDLVRNVDDFHLASDSYSLRGEREVAVAMGVLGFASSVSFFTIASATGNTTTTTVTVSHGEGADFGFVDLNHGGGTGQDTSSRANIQSFEVSDDGGTTWQSTTGVRTNATTITLTHDTALSAAPNRLRYFYGANNSGGVVRDDTGLTWPLQFEMDLTI